MKPQVVLGSILLLTSCAMPTTPVRREVAKTVPASQILDAELLQPNVTRTERVLIVRDEGFMGGGLELLIKLDKRPVASFKAGEMAVIYLAPGRYQVSIEEKKNHFNENPGESDIEILRGGLNNFRIRLVPGDEPRFQRSNQLE